MLSRSGSLHASTVLSLLVAACADDPEPRGSDDAAVADTSVAPDLATPQDAGEPDVIAPEDAEPPSPDGSILPSRDAGDPFGDAGPLGPPEWQALDVVDAGECDPLIACGGDELGTWDVAGGCIEVPVPMELMRCPGAAVTRREGRARGRVTFEDGVADRTAQFEVELEVFVPELCAGFVGGCEVIASRFAAVAPDSACVTEAEGDCRCAARQTGVIDDGDAYAIESDQIVSTTSGKRWDYCVEGTLLRYRDVSGTTMLEPGIITLERR